MPVFCVSEDWFSPRPLIRISASCRTLKVGWWYSPIAFPGSTNASIGTAYDPQSTYCAHNKSCNEPFIVYKNKYLSEYIQRTDKYRVEGGGIVHGEGPRQKIMLYSACPGSQLVI